MTEHTAYCRRRLSTPELLRLKQHGGALTAAEERWVGLWLARRERQSITAALAVVGEPAPPEAAPERRTA